MPRPAAAFCLAIALTLSSALVAQAPPVRWGMTAGVVSFNAIRSEQAVTTTLEYDPTSWLTLSMIPSGVRIAQSQTATAPAASRTGIADLPVSAAASFTLPGSLSPNLGAGVTVGLPTASCGLGSSVTSVGLDAGAGIAPSDAFHLSVDATRSLTSGVARSAFIPAQSTWVSTDATVIPSERWTATLSYGAAYGVPDSIAPRELGGGVSYNIRGPLALTLDASHGLTHGSPRWVFSIGIGTAFSGTSPVTPTEPFRRLRTTFVAGKLVTTTTTPCQ
ncbi:MAG TPA: hypothetical protein VM736_09350 [Gemmatimonadales bacterium]|nr:hypothetical protein [Gemmatimonadales bacterium]